MGRLTYTRLSLPSSPWASEAEKHVIRIVYPKVMVSHGSIKVGATNSEGNLRNFIRANN